MRDNVAMDRDVAALAGLVFEASNVLLVTGAGISTESGIPDYRGPKGVWNTQRPVEFQDFVRSHEKRVQSWDQKLVGSEFVNAAAPGGVHRAAVELEEDGRLGMIVTQNIDGLHTLAGTSPGKVIEIHGTALFASCLDCSERSPINPHLEAFAETREPPLCDECGGLLKQATISFGQQLDPFSVQGALDAAEACDLVIALGTSLSVYPAAELPLHAARRGVPYAIVNQGRTEHDQSLLVTLRIDGEVGPVFSEAVALALSG